METKNETPNLQELPIDKAYGALKNLIRKQAVNADTHEALNMCLDTLNSKACEVKDLKSKIAEQDEIIEKLKNSKK